MFVDTVSFMYHLIHWSHLLYVWGWVTLESANSSLALAQAFYGGLEYATDLHVTLHADVSTTRMTLKVVATWTATPKGNMSIMTWATYPWSSWKVWTATEAEITDVGQSESLVQTRRERNTWGHADTFRDGVFFAEKFAYTHAEVYRSEVSFHCIALCFLATIWRCTTCQLVHLPLWLPLRRGPCYLTLSALDKSLCRPHKAWSPPAWSWKMDICFHGRSE